MSTKQIIAGLAIAAGLVVPSTASAASKPSLSIRSAKATVVQQRAAYIAWYTEEVDDPWAEGRATYVFTSIVSTPVTCKRKKRNLVDCKTQIDFTSDDTADGYGCIYSERHTIKLRLARGHGGAISAWTPPEGGDFSSVASGAVVTMDTCSDG